MIRRLSPVHGLWVEQVLNRVWMGTRFFAVFRIHRRLKGFKPINRGCPLNCPQAYPHAPVNKVKNLGSGVALLLLDPVGELGDLVVNHTAFRHELTDLAVCVDHGGVVAAAEFLADLGK